MKSFRCVCMSVILLKTFYSFDTWNEAQELPQCHNEINWYSHASLDSNFACCLRAASTKALDHNTSPSEIQQCGLADSHLRRLEGDLEDCCKPLQALWICSRWANSCQFTNWTHIVKFTVAFPKQIFVFIFVARPRNLLGLTAHDLPNYSCFNVWLTCCSPSRIPTLPTNITQAGLTKYRRFRHANFPNTTSPKIILTLGKCIDVNIRIHQSN